MAVYKVGGVAMPVVSDNILDGLQSSESGEAAVLKNVIDLTHPKIEGSVDSSRYFRSDRLNQFAIGRSGIRKAHTNTFSMRLGE
jgi:hypothetical protein